MNLVRELQVQRRQTLRTLHMLYARYAPWIPAMYPDFMCIGAPRAATTWLHTNLRSDPQIFLPKAKELHFFDVRVDRDHADDSGLRWHRSFYFDVDNPIHLRWYWMQFRKGKGRMKGEITPSYSMLSKERVRLILGKMPDLKVIYIIRNPIDLAWSTLRKVVLYQRGPNQSILHDLAWVLRTVLHPLLLEGGNYRRAIETWSGMVRDQNMLYLFHDDILEDPQAQLRKVYSFLGLDWQQSAPSNVEKRVNAAPELAMPPQVHSQLAQYYRGQIEYLEAKFNRKLGHWKEVA